MWLPMLKKLLVVEKLPIKPENSGSENVKGIPYICMNVLKLPPPSFSLSNTIFSSTSSYHILYYNIYNIFPLTF